MKNMMSRKLPMILASLVGLAFLVGCEQQEQPVAMGSELTPSPTEEVKPSAPFARDFTVQAISDSKKVKLSDFKGKVVLVDFWATWCGPCRMIMPTVDNLYKKYKSEGFDVVAISREDPATITGFLKEENYSYPFYQDFAGLAEQAYAVDAIPMTMVIDREGRLIYQETGANPSGLADAVDKAMSKRA
jgi:thiol-disulfide isomerase/thioredoxin